MAASSSRPGLTEAVVREQVGEFSHRDLYHQELSLRSVLCSSFQRSRSKSTRDIRFLITTHSQSGRIGPRALLIIFSSTWPSAGSSARPTQAVALGLGSLFNHSTLYQNVGWKRLVAEQSIQYTALRNIPEGEELCISYGSPGVLWFEDADAEAVEKHQRDERDITFAESVNGEMAVSGLADIELDIA